MNREPTAILLPLRDVLAWIPTLTRKRLYGWERKGLIHPVRQNRKGFPRRKGEIGYRMYPTIELLKLAKLYCGTNGHDRVRKKRKGRKKK